jgi:hypothetical protein
MLSHSFDNKEYLLSVYGASFFCFAGMAPTPEKALLRKEIAGTVILGFAVAHHTGADFKKSFLTWRPSWR